MRFGSKTHAQMSSRMTRLQGLRWIKGIAIRFSISPLAVENELDRPPQMSTERKESRKLRRSFHDPAAHHCE